MNLIAFIRDIWRKAKLDRRREERRNLLLPADQLEVNDLSDEAHLRLFGKERD